MQIFKKLFTLCLTLGFCQSAFGWGEEGHKVVALIAEQKLSPEARKNIDSILQRPGNGKISDLATWADQVRGDDSVPQISHVVRIPFKAHDYSPERDCAGKHSCVIEGIQKSVKALEASTLGEASTLKPEYALKFLVHYVGDIHQPLHAIQETGRMRTLPSRQRWTLHKIWDTIIIRSMHQSPERMAKRLLTKSEKIDQGAPEAWAMESHEIAKRVIYGGSYALARSKDPIPLGDDYYKENTKIVDERLFAAGVRLGNLLNSILK